MFYHQERQAQAQSQRGFAVQESGAFFFRQLGYVFQISLNGIAKLAEDFLPAFPLRRQVEVNANRLPIAGAPPCVAGKFAHRRFPFLSKLVKYGI